MATGMVEGGCENFCPTTRRPTRERRLSTVHASTLERHALGMPRSASGRAAKQARSSAIGGMLRHQQNQRPAPSRAETALFVFGAGVGIGAFFFFFRRPLARTRMQGV